MLHVGGGRLIRTFLALQHDDLGFDPDRVLTGFVRPGRCADHWYRDVSASYFSVMNIPLRHGRLFTGEMKPLVVINETAARTFRPGEGSDRQADAAGAGPPVARRAMRIDPMDALRVE